jgi:1-aminocyclopropane-1-carboxylate deaminase
MVELNIPSPVQHVDSINNVNLYIKREDLIHSSFGGNKWRKLKYNLQEYKDKNHKTLITFGGAFSNHIAATASICNQYNIPSVGIIRGTYEDKNNPTLNLAKEDGMQLYNVPKLEYKLMGESGRIKKIINNYPNSLVVPEGGSNEFAKAGVMEVIKELDGAILFDHIVVAAGTGMTATGIIEASNEKTKIWVVNVLRNESLEQTISNWLLTEKNNWEVLSSFDFGGYAKVPDELKQFANNFYEKYQILLDPIYTSKMMFATLDMIQSKKFTKGENVLAIHTGGLQGIKGFEYVTKSNWINV